MPSPPSTMLCGGGARSNTLSVLKSHWRLGIYAVLLMTAFNFFGHGTQGLYPIFLQVQHGCAPHEVGLIAVIYNIGAIIGGVSLAVREVRTAAPGCVLAGLPLSIRSDRNGEHLQGELSSWKQR